MASHIINVEILCKFLCKTLCNTSAKICSKLHSIYPFSAKLHFPTNFSHSSHRLFHTRATPYVQLFYPLFHNLYYYNYYIYLIDRKKGLS